MITPMFIAILLIIAQTQKKPRCLLVGEQINNQQYIQMMEYYSALKEKSYQDKKKYIEKTQMNITKSKKKKKKLHCMISVILHSGKGKTMDTTTTTRNQQLPEFGGRKR